MNAPPGQVKFVVGISILVVALLGVGFNAVVDAVGDGDGGDEDRPDPAFVEIPVDPAREVAVGAGAVWVARNGDEDDEVVDAVVRIDPASGEITDEIEIERPQGLAATDDAVWVGGGGDDLADPSVLARVDPATDQVVAEVPMPGMPAENGVAAGPAGVWVITQDVRLVQVDPVTDAVVREMPVEASSPQLAVGEDAAWISPGGAGESELQRIDAATGEVTRIDLATGEDDPATTSTVLGPVTAGDGAAWVVRSHFDFGSPAMTVDLCRVDAAGSEDVHCVDTGFDLLDEREIKAIAHGEEALWAAVEGVETSSGTSRSQVLRIDPDSLDVTTKTEIRSASFVDIAAGEGRGGAWATGAIAEDPRLLGIRE